MLRRQDGFRLFLKDGHVEMDTNPVEDGIRSPAMSRRDVLFAGNDEGGRSRARFATLVGTCNTNGVDSYASLRDLFAKRASGPVDEDTDASLLWALRPPQRACRGVPSEFIP